MQQINEIESVKDKIRKLLNFTTTNGCNEQEALNYAAKVGELLQIYDLNIQDLLLDKEECIKHNIPMDGTRNFMKNMIVNIARYAQVKVWMQAKYNYNPQLGKYVKGIDCVFFGMPNDVEMAKFLYEIVNRAIENETEKYKKSDSYRLNKMYSHGRAVTVSFQHGLINRLNDKLVELAKKREEELEKEVQYTDSVTHKNITTSIIHIKENKVDSAYEKLGLNLKFSKVFRRISDNNAYNNGREAANNVNLNRPIDGSSNTKLLS